MSDSVAQNNKRIAKNTLMLYVRMFITLVVGLFTSRVVLNTLGVEDYGIYNVVGGVVMMMSFINNSMAVATGRFLTIELGKGDIKQFHRVFSTCLAIFLALGIIIVVLAETLGLWFVNTQLVIPEERMVAANWVYQMSIISCVVSLLIIPYNSAVIANERMNIFAYVSILDTVLKLGIVYLLLIIPADKLCVYGSLVLVVSFVNLACYTIYSRRKLQGCKFVQVKDKKLIGELLSYSWWNMFGSLSMMAKGQGLNILLNMFFNPAVNAARAIAYQINNLVNQFFTSFYTAVQPQITKYYAQGDKENMNKLIFRSSKFSFFLILIIALPIIFQSPYLISLWLGQLPEYVIPFVRIIILITAIDAMSYPIMTAVQATGKIRGYQVTIGLFTLLNLPISYVFLKFGCSPLIVFWVSLCISFIAVFIRLGFIKKLTGFPVTQFIMEVIIRVIVVTAIATVIPLLVQRSLSDINFVNFIVNAITCVASAVICIWTFGTTKEEKVYINRLLLKLFHKGNDKH